ncbi:MAG: DUF481 domain-containing protein [Candidatus Magnetomorum sp.]|nr:DUF481 domain-containing protein [Candidatus Magnetomorum sp.]
MKKINIWITLVLISIPIFGIAEDTVNVTQTQTISEQTKDAFPLLKWISNGESFGKWWLRRSRDYQPPDEILYHLELKYTFNNTTGNEELTRHKMNGSLTLRKDFFTNYLSYSLKKKELDYRGSIIKNEKEILENTVFAEILPFMDILATYQWEADDKKYYLNRYTYHGGLYFTLVNSKQLIFKVGGFFGHDKIEYMNELSELMGKKQEDADEDFFSVYQRSNWFITDSISFSEKLKYRTFTGSSSYRIEFVGDLNCQVSKNIALNVSYEIERESTEQKMNIEKEDRDLTVGIKLSF